MEIELKYRLKEESTGEALFREFSDKGMILEGSVRDDRLCSIYYDTEDGQLEKVRAAFRIRKKKEQYEATLKWGGGVDQGLHERKEINLPLDNENLSVNPDISVFKNIEPHIDFIDNVKGQLIKTVETDFKRLSWRVSDGQSTVVEFCFDRGMIVSGGRMEPILELEAELIEGDRNRLLSIGTEIADKYGLEPEMRSKYERGLALYKDN